VHNCGEGVHKGWTGRAHAPKKGKQADRSHICKTFFSTFDTFRVEKSYSKTKHHIEYCKRTSIFLCGAKYFYDLFLKHYGNQTISPCITLVF
jgi:hypothetical protein